MALQVAQLGVVVRVAVLDHLDGDLLCQDEIPELVNQFIQESKEITQCYAYDFTPK